MKKSLFSALAAVCALAMIACAGPPVMAAEPTQPAVIGASNAGPATNSMIATDVVVVIYAQDQVDSLGMLMPASTTEPAVTLGASSKARYHLAPAATFRSVDARMTTAPPRTSIT